MLHRENLNISKTKLINLLSFLLAFTESSFIYVLSSYFASTIKNDNVSIFYLIAYTLSLIGLFLLRPAIKTIGKIRLLSIFFVFLIILSAFLAKIPVSWFGAAILIGVIVFINLVWVSFDIILEGYSADEVSGEVRGMHLALISVGSICGPLVSTQTLSHFGFNQRIILWYDR
jgi:MFS family permease